MGNVYIGTSGYSYKDWKDVFYLKGIPQKKWLAYYAQHYSTVEINATFYRYFAPTVFTRWRDETPDTFRFTLKGPRDITHTKRLHEIETELSRFLDSIQDLRSKLAMLLWQFPPSFKYDMDNAKIKFTQFVERLPGEIEHVVEFRHKSWFNDDLYSLLNQHNVGIVMNDSSRFSAIEMVTGNFAYIRFHGPTKLYASLYSIEELRMWADKMQAWLQHYDVYAYFNNDYGGRAIQNSIELKQLISGAQ